MIDFNKLIDNYIVREYKPKTIGRYYPSEVGGCLRKTWFSYKNPKAMDSETLRIFEAGNMLHEFVADVIRSEKNPEVELVKSEMPIKIETEKFTISGRIDNLVLVKMNNKEVLVEVKSIKFLPKAHRAEHEMQLQLYMMATGICDGIILYVQKDNLQTASFPIIYSKEKSDKIIARFDILHESLTSGEMPDAEAKNDPEKSWMCDYCNWRDECDGRDGNE